LAEKSLSAIPHGFAGILAGQNKLICLTEGACAFADRLECQRDEYRYGVRVRVADCNQKNSQILRLFLKWTAPAACGETSSLSIEDDFGLLFPSFARSLAGEKLKPVLSSNLDTPENLTRAMGEAAWQSLAAGLKGGYGAEYAYATNETEIMNALLCGYTGIALDAAAKIDLTALDLSDAEALTCFDKLPQEFRANLLFCYNEKSFPLGDGFLSYRQADLARLTLCYGETIAYLEYIYKSYFKNAPWPVDFSLRLGRLPAAAHYLLANELKQAGVQVTAIEADPAAPEFPAATAVAETLRHKLRIVLDENSRQRLNELPPLKCGLDFRAPKGSGLTDAWAVLPPAARAAIGEDERPDAASLFKHKAALKAAVTEQPAIYRQQAEARIERDKQLLLRLAGE
jgi:hypothetical protein